MLSGIFFTLKYAGGVYTIGMIEYWTFCAYVDILVVDNRTCLQYYFLLWSYSSLTRMHMCKIIETVARVNFLKVETQQSSGGAETIREMEEWLVYRKWRNFVKLWTRFIKSWGSLMERIQGLVLLSGGGGKGAPGGGCSYCKNSVFFNNFVYIESKV